MYLHKPLRAGGAGLTGALGREGLPLPPALRMGGPGPGHAATSGSREASRQPAARQGLPSCKRKELDSDNLSEQGPRFSLRVSGKGAALDTWMLAADTHVRLMTYRQERACVKL